MSDDFKINPSVSTESEDVYKTDREREHAHSLIRKAGQLIEPKETKYIGSAVIHYYAGKHELDVARFKVATQLLIANVPEGLAAQGGNTLYKDLMKAYGAKIPRKIK